MEHFGQFLKKLRETRGFTQPAVAEAAGLSMPTIQRAEASPRCVFTRSNARRVFEAFEKLTPPLSPDERNTFLRGSGLDAILASAMQLRPTSADRALGALLDALTDPAERAAYEALDELITDLGPQTALAALTGVRTGIVTRLQASAKPRLIVHEQPIIEEDWEVRKIKPGPTPDNTRSQRRATDAS